MPSFINVKIDDSIIYNGPSFVNNTHQSNLEAQRGIFNL